MEPEVFLLLATLTIGCVVAFIWYLFGSVIIALRKKSADAEAKQIENERQRYLLDLVAPDARGALPVPGDLIRSGASVEQLLALLTQVVEANKIHPMPPQHLTYAPHTSADRSLDITGATGLNQATGGGTYTLLDAIDQDIRFGMAIPKRDELEDDYADE